ncbi:hypothetical protein [Bdellovibrio sp. NC01]|uniref:hypothetical protein n=1 Tax=Bdellovibrio sp. NC01 TaxID=2220073 RepID=UPI00143CE424|nr:hypothetical protein [Bdellovibrio sp. NC01]
MMALETAWSCLATSTHLWDSTSPAFHKIQDEIQDRYASIYGRIGTLCLGQSPNQQCWNHYCSSGGVRYEFEYDPEFKSGVSRRSVIYDDNKTFNLHKFMLNSDLHPAVRSLLESTDAMDMQKAAIMLAWMQTSQPGELTVAHLTEEIPFKKKTAFQFEDEFRFVQMIEVREPVTVKWPLVDQKSPLEQLGLRLVGIATSDVAKVKTELPQHEPIIYEVNS